MKQSQNPDILSHTIEHTCLKSDAISSDIVQLCEEAVKYGFFAVCVNSAWIGLVTNFLDSTPVKTVSTAAFPLGASATLVKCREVEYAISEGADEVDFVLNIGKLKSGDLNFVSNEFQELIKAASGTPLKVILETCLLTDNEKTTVCQLAVDCGIAFVKTSTGFGKTGATLEDIKLMRHSVGKYAGVKASGGIRDLKTAKEMLRAGADRLGASASVAIMLSIKEELS